jgi:DNA invertase Pin-like site-specific DNA recombinase
MTSPTYGYARSPAAAESAALPVDGQLALVADYCASRGWALAGRFIDGPETAKAAWLDRPAGRELGALLAPGSKVVVAGPESIYTSATELLAIVKSFRDRGIALHMVAARSERRPRIGPLSTEGMAGELMETVLTLMLDLRRASHGEKVRRGMELRRSSGLKYCRHAGYGYAWCGSRRVRDAYEQATIRRIIEWREVYACSFEAIAAHLLRNCVTTGAGRDWSASRVRRAYFAWAHEHSQLMPI